MARKVDQAKHKAWRQRIVRQQKSGLTVVEFCRQEGVSTANFHAWKRKLGIGRSSRDGRAIHRRKAGAEADCREKALGTQATVPFVQLPLSAPVASPWIEVVLAEGAVVRLPQQNLSALETVLQSLKGNLPALAAEEVRHA